MTVTPAMSMLKAYTVLVVDDCVMTRVTVTEVLKAAGCETILEASDGLEALEILKTTPLHIVISDWNMPNLNGIDFLRQARGNLKVLDTRFIMLTGESDAAKVKEAIAYGFDSYITKPIDAEILQHRVEYVLSEMHMNFATYLADASVLLVEDSRAIRSVMINLMSNIGLQSVHTLENAQDAVAYLESGQTPDVVISDWNLPQMNGLEFLAWMRDRKATQHVPFMMISSEKKPERVQEALSKGVDEYLIKPFHQEEIARKMVRALKNSAA